MNLDRLRAPAIGLPSYKPGTIIMHTRQYNKLCDAGLLRTRTATGREPETSWNGAPVIRDDSMPLAGWFIVPSILETIEHERIIVKPQEDDGE